MRYKFVKSVIDMETVKKQLEKNTFISEVLSAKPQDYADRNKVYRQLAKYCGFALQGISIVFSAYLLFDVIDRIFEIGLFNALFYSVIALCLVLFTFVEGLRRWLIDTIGYHYMATFDVIDKHKKRGELLKLKTFATALISVVMITTGVSGVYQFVYNVSPKAKTQDVKTVVKPISDNITAQTQSVKEADRQITDLQSKINAIISNNANYSVWNGTKYITPTADVSVKAFNAQIQEINKAKQKSLDIIYNSQSRANVLEDKTHNENKHLTLLNTNDRFTLSVTVGVIWLIFELLLFLAIAFEWVYKYNVKLEAKLENITKSVMPTKTESVKHPRQRVNALFGNVKRKIQNVSENITKSVNPIKPITANFETPPISVVGFEVGTNKTESDIPESKHTVVVDTVVRVAQDGYECKCLTCGKVTRTKRQAKFCPDTKDESGKKITSQCRNTWHNTDRFTREEKLKRWVNRGFDVNDFKG